MADVALISVIASGTVGILGAAAGFYGQHVTVRNEDQKRQEARREDLRSVLDGAAEAALRFMTPFLAAKPTSGSIVSELNGLLPELGTQLARLGIRVGTKSPAYESFQRVLDEVGTLTTAIDAIPSHLTLDDAAKSPDLAEAHEGAVRAINRVNDSIDRFLDASTALVGV